MAFKRLEIFKSYEKSNENYPVQIVETDYFQTPGQHSFTLNEKALSEILLDPQVADKKVEVVSVAGAFRKGKSFLLNFFLRYLQKYHEHLSNGAADVSRGLWDWLGKDDEILAGFHWRGGCERETSGIFLWRHPFLFELANGEKAALLLMDTQGVFDNQSTVKDCATIFALSTMISSVQIYNLSQTIQEDYLQHLQLFTEYGRLAVEASNAKPFQTLIFLVRDWSFPYETPYGFEGGKKFLEKRFQISDKQHQELQQLRKHIKSCFTDTECFLMPHPGLKVATDKNFQGQLCDIEQEFKEQLSIFVENVLPPKRRALKAINGEHVTCRELLEYFRSYVKIFQGQELPEPKSMLLATAEANNLAAVAIAKALYRSKMEEVCSGDKQYISAEILESHHEENREKALNLFNSVKKMGGDEFSAAFLIKLDDEILESYDQYIKVNNSKNFFRFARTPAVLFAFLVIYYILGEIFEFCGSESMASICKSILGLIMIILSIWGYIKYSGRFRNFGQKIDNVATFLWKKVLLPVSKFALKKSVNTAVKLKKNLSLPKLKADFHSRQIRMKQK